jgi:hypothetical protein
MNSTNSKSMASNAAMEVDLLPYLEALIRWRLSIALAALASALLVAAWAHSKPYMYQSTARVSIVDIEDPGGVSPDDRRASEVLTLVEHGFVMGTTHDNYNDVVLARLRSREFATRFLDRNNVYRHFYPEQWLEEQGAWAEGFEPDRGEVLTWFRDQVRVIDRDEETDIVSVSMSSHDAMLARDLANLYVREFNEFMRERTMREVSSKQAFLEAELRRAEVVEMQKSIYRLIEAQTAIAMLASAREEYVLEIIDPAALAYRSFSMSRKKKIFIGAIAGALLATFGLLAWVMLARMLHSINECRRGQSVDETGPEAANSRSNF